MSNIIGRKYNVLGAYVGPGNYTGNLTGAFIPQQLTRVQTWTDSFTRNFTPITEFGVLAPIDLLEPGSPDVTATTSWFAVDGSVENRVGLTVTTGTQTLTSILSGILNNTTNVKDYFLEIVDNVDAISSPSNTGALTIGNGVINTYTIQGSVSDIVSASLDIQGYNIKYISGLNGTDTTASVNQSGAPIGNIFVLPQYLANNFAGEITAMTKTNVDLQVSGALGYVNFNPQSFNLSIPLNRTPINVLGSRFPFALDITPPFPATMTVAAEITDIQNGNLANLICQTGFVNATLILRAPNCSGVGSPALAFYLIGAKLSQQDDSYQIGSNATVNMTFTAYVGSASDTIHNVYCSGSYLS